jgi:hypothetical protein
VRNELAVVWKEATIAESEICLKGLKGTIKDLSQDSESRGRDSNRSPPEYKSEALPLEPLCSG